MQFSFILGDFTLWKLNECMQTSKNENELFVRGNSGGSSSSVGLLHNQQLCGFSQPDVSLLNMLVHTFCYCSRTKKLFLDT